MGISSRNLNSRPQTRQVKIENSMLDLNELEQLSPDHIDLTRERKMLGAKNK